MLEIGSSFVVKMSQMQQQNLRPMSLIMLLHPFKRITQVILFCYPMHMSSQAEKLHQLIQLIDEFDTFGKLNRDMSLLSVAIGTLRKDRSIAQDIYGLSGASSDGLGMLALSRILTEDYLHLLFLNENQESLAEQIDNFNAHPTIEHYVSLKAMEEWGFEFDESQDTKDLIAKVTAGFEKNKERFLRRRETENSFDPDDYYRTWTKVNLNELVKRSGLAVTDEGKEV